MADKRTVTISVTINLGNYENLRLEVSDAAETKEEADNLRLFLAEVLDGYAANNATAKSIIEKYKDRVLDNYKEESEVAADLSDPFAGDLEAEVTGEIPVGAPAPAAADVLPVPTDAEAAEFVCEKCGAPVTKLQRDVSQLFNRKVLCKNCMK